MTGREELGFPKVFADFTDIAWDREARTASCSASWLDHTFFDISLTDLTEVPNPEKSLPGAGSGPQLYFKYMPRTSPDGAEGADLGYVTTGAPRSDSGPAQNISFDDFEFQRWTATGSFAWHRATFEQNPLFYPIINTLADLDMIEMVDAEMVAFSGPGIAISVNSMRAVEPATAIANQYGGVA